MRWTSACTTFATAPSMRAGTVDDSPFGGGPGMVLMPEPVFRAVEAVDAAAATGG